LWHDLAHRNWVAGAFLAFVVVPRLALERHEAVLRVDALGKVAEGATVRTGANDIRAKVAAGLRCLSVVWIKILDEKKRTEGLN
jgi:hypothetical protein